MLQAIAKPLNNKMSQFGTIALDQFKQRLPEWPLYCSRLRGIPNLAQALPGVAPLVLAMNGTSQTFPGAVCAAVSFRPVACIVIASI